MVVVPLLAMFSHKIPPAARRAARDSLWQPICRTVAGWLDTEPAEPPPVTVVANPRDAVPSAPVPPAFVPPPSAPTEPAVKSLPTVSITAALVPTADAGATEKLAHLGAVNVQVKPVDASGAVHMASCRVPVDSVGQLQRLFQATGSTPEESVQRLLDEVARWKTQVAAAPQPIGGTPAKPMAVLPDAPSPPPSPTRFQ